MCGNEQRVAAQVTEFGLAANVDHIQAEGYTIIEAPAPADFVERLRAAILRRKETDGVLNYLIGKDAIFEDALLNPKLQAFAEAVCGPNPLLFQLAATSRPQGDEAIPTHADNATLPTPHPPWESIVTLCWPCDEFTEAGGCTKVIPGSHIHRRPPTREEAEQERGAIPVECVKGSVVCRTGSTWHGNYPRTLPGNRVALHISLCRSHFKPLENYRHLDESWFDGKPEKLRGLLNVDRPTYKPGRDA